MVDRAKDLYKAKDLSVLQPVLRVPRAPAGSADRDVSIPVFFDATVMVFYQLLVPVITNRWPWAMTARMVCKTALFFFAVLYKPSFFPPQSESVRIWLNELRLFVT